MDLANSIDSTNSIDSINSMDIMDLIRDKFSQDCTIETVLHLVMAHFDLSEGEAQAKIDEYFDIVENYCN